MPRPSGTVTLLFSDVEGSTRLWERAPAQMALAIERHDAIVRAAVETHDGYVFKTMGDEFCVAFASAAAAASAATEAQRALAAEPWPEGAKIRARMALHTGACQERDDDYFGPAVNRVARLMAIGHGGQVLCSGATSELLGDAGPDSVSLRDLGLHRLRDLGRPEHVFQLAAQGLASEFPPLRSLDNPDLPNNLPALLSAFVGREHELDEVRRHVAEARLVTLTGAGGAGKTRLAMQAAAELLDGTGDGVWLVELAPITDEAHVPLAISAVLGLKESVDVDAHEALLTALAPQRSLLVLDNCEHLVDRVAKLADAILRRCPGVHVIATSREPLGVDGERVYRVPSMGVPDEDVDTLDEAAGFDAVVLFTSRAADVGAVIPEGDAALVGSVCRRLDGIPLALELAAARLSSMSLQQLADRLDQRFRLLTGGSRSAMARQQTLQALVDWSYGLLNPSEQSVLRRLSVFAGGFELDAAETVCTGDDVDEFDVLNLLHSLVEKSLVVADQDAGSVRYRLLETIRQYGAAELLRDGGETAVLEARDRHAAYFLELAGLAGAELAGREQATWLHRLDLEADNLRAALAHLGADPTRSRDVLTMVTALERYFRSRSAVDVIPRLISALEELREERDELIARALISVSIFIGWLIGSSDRDQTSRAGAFALRAHDMARELGLTALQARAAQVYAMFCQFNLDLDAAVSYLTEAQSLLEGLDEPGLLREWLVFSINPRIRAATGLSHDEFVERAERSHALALAAGDASGLAGSLAQLAHLAADAGNEAEARRYFLESIALNESLGNKEPLFSSSNNLLLSEVALGLHDEAMVTLRRCVRLNRRSGMRSPSGDLIFAAAVIAGAKGDHARAARLLATADVVRTVAYETGDLFITEGEIAMHRATTEAALAALGPEVFEREQSIGRTLDEATALHDAVADVPGDTAT